MKLLLISNSTNAGEAYLEYPMPRIDQFLGKSGIKSAIFIPYAAVTFSFDEYLEKVEKRFGDIGIKIESIHTFSDKQEAITNAEAIVVGGGNTFQLVKMMQEDDIMDTITQKVTNGTPYIGWSAGSNVATPSLCTTNDMPIVEPLSFKTLGLVDFQINPHYTDIHPKDHAGESRDQRIEEYIAANKDTFVVGLREGCMLQIEGHEIELIGDKSIKIFRYGEPTKELKNSDNLSFLIEK